MKGMELYDELLQWFVDRNNNVKGRVTSEMIIHKAGQIKKSGVGVARVGGYPGVMYLIGLCLVCLPWG